MKIPSILLIDDDEITNYLNQVTIMQADITDELLISPNGKAALDLIQDRCNNDKDKLPNLILLDINMPILDGFGFLEAFGNLKNIQDHNVVLAVLTTSLNPKDINRAKSAGVSEFLNKPLTIHALEKLVNKYFSNGTVSFRQDKIN